RLWNVSARAGWARCTAPAILVCRATWRSKCCPPNLPAMRGCARFDREARAISALNHPHICTLHDIGRENGFDYLVMEYCEGQTLAQRLERGGLPLDQVLQYGIEIAEAL